MKRLLCLAVIALLAAGLVACGGGQQPAPAAKDKAPAATAAKEAPKEAPKEQPKEQIKYPERPINFIVPYEPASGPDIIGRKLGEIVSRKFGQPFLYVNKPGASGSIGAKDIYEAKPDGYTIGNYCNMETNKLQGVFPYNQNDFSMIGVVNTAACVLIANNKAPWKTVKELIDYAKAHPDEVRASTSNKGAYWWLGSAVFQKVTGTKLNVIPQAGAGAYPVTQCAGGHTELAFTGSAEAKAQIEAGNVRVLAIMGSERVSGKGYENAPTLKELGYKDSEVYTVRPVNAPPKLPKPIFDKLTQAFGEAAQSDEYKKFALDLQTIPLWLPGEQGAKFYSDREATYIPIMRDAGMLKEAK